MAKQLAKAVTTFTTYPPAASAGISLFDAKRSPRLSKWWKMTSGLYHLLGPILPTISGCCGVSSKIVKIVRGSIEGDIGRIAVTIFPPLSTFVTERNRGRRREIVA